jgi:8-amino-7-oxononanoate synthase
MGIDYLNSCIEKELEYLKSVNRYRELKSSSGIGIPLLNEELNILADRLSAELLSFNSLSTNETNNLNLNDYLGIGRTGILDEQISDLALRFPIGSHSSRLLGGNHQIFEALENEICNHLNKDSALYFNSGFNANETLANLLSFEGISFFSDQLNHASIIDGIRHSNIPKENRHVFGHLDYDELESKLKESDSKCNIIFCEAIYSMDGTKSDLPRLKQLAENYNGVVIVDEAHSYGVVGKEGAGLYSQLEPSENFISVVTCGKAVATSGAFILGNKILRDYLINKSRQFIYTTAPSPLVAAATLLSIKIIRRSNELRARLETVASSFRNDLRKKQINIGNSESHILPIITGCEVSANSLARKLLSKKITCGAIRPPTVPQGESRIRISLHPGIGENQLGNILKTADTFARENSL